MKTTEMPGEPCPECGDKLDRATSPKGETPEPGDVSICFNCGTILVFDDKLVSKRPDDEVELLLVMPLKTRSQLIQVQAEVKRRGRLRQRKA